VVTLTTMASLLVALALGGMVFFAAVYAPVIFRTLAPEPAGRLLRALFPVYYKVNAGLTGLAAACLALRPEGWLLAAVCALFLASMLLLMPRINRARDLWVAGDEDARRRFNRLHRGSVAINVVQMVVLLGVFLRLAT
jgi:hypothetical protein